MNYDLIVKARQVLAPLWRKAWLKGLCWGPKSEKNPYSATNITICIDNELVSVSQKGERLIVNEFQRTTDTKLGRQVRELLQKAGLLPKRSEILSSSGYTWYCKTCDKGGEVDAGLAGEVDSRGAGARDLANRIYRAHEDASPGCPPDNLEVIDPQMVKQPDLVKLISLKRE